MGYARTVALLSILMGNLPSCAHPNKTSPERVHSLARELKGGWIGAQRVALEPWEEKVVLLSFFATWCFPCLLEIPILQKLHESYADKGLVVVLVGMDLEGEKTLKPYSELSKLPFPVVVASDRLKGGDTWLSQIQELPTHVFINRRGEVVFIQAGSFSPEVLDDFKKWFR